MNYVIVGFLLLKIVTAEEINEKICLAATMCFDGKNTTSEWLDVSPRTRQENIAELDEIKKDLASLKNQNGVMKETITELNSATIAHRQEMTSLEEAIEDLNSTVIAKGQEITIECDDGVSYNGECYFAIFHSITYDQKESICNDAGGKIAGIWNKQHQTLIEIYVRAKMLNADHPDPYTSTWLSMTYDENTKTLTMPNGNSFPSTTIRWVPGYPWPGTIYTAVRIQVNEDESYFYQGVYNYPPMAKSYGVLCVK